MSGENGVNWMGTTFVRAGSFITVSFQDDIAHATFVEERCDGVGPDILVTVHHEDDVLSVGDPSIDFACKIIEDGLSWFSILIFGLEVRALLSPRSERR